MQADERTMRHTFAAMGSAAEILWEGGGESLGREGEARLGHLEDLWSRFRDGSEISRLNRQVPGSPCLVSEETYTLVRMTLLAWDLTDGRFDPRVYDTLLGSGYDDTFERIRSGTRAPAEPIGLSGRPDIVLDPVVGSVTLGPGTRLDPGGIGKGLAADIVSHELLRAGAHGVMVNVGGDVRVRTAPDHDIAWSVSVEDPTDPGLDSGRVWLADGAVATSSSRRRSWRAGNRRVHHLIDPTRGVPTDRGVMSATVIAAEAWWAEAVTKAVFVAGLAHAGVLLEQFGVAGVVFGEDGTNHALNIDVLTASGRHHAPDLPSFDPSGTRARPSQRAQASSS